MEGRNVKLYQIDCIEFYSSEQAVPDIYHEYGKPAYHQHMSYPSPTSGPDTEVIFYQDRSPSAPDYSAPWYHAQSAPAPPPPAPPPIPVPPMASQARKQRRGMAAPSAARRSGRRSQPSPPPPASRARFQLEEDGESPPPPAPPSPRRSAACETERPSKLDLPRGGSGRRHKYVVVGYSAGDTPSNSNLTLTPSDASDDSSSYLSARDSGVAMTSGSGSQTRFRFSPPLSSSAGVDFNDGQTTSAVDHPNISKLSSSSPYKTRQPHYRN
jgi:hypothetical protein